MDENQENIENKEMLEIPLNYSLAGCYTVTTFTNVNCSGIQYNTVVAPAIYHPDNTRAIFLQFSVFSFKKQDNGLPKGKSWYAYKTSHRASPCLPWMFRLVVVINYV